jgi:hypothetical protein
MKANLVTVNRVLRKVAAIVIELPNFTKVISANLAIVLIVFDGIFVLSNFIGVCA